MREIYASSPSVAQAVSSPYDFIMSHFGQNFDPLSFALSAGAIGNTISIFGVPCYIERPITIGHCSINVQTVGGVGSQLSVGYYAMTGVGTGTLAVSSTFNTSAGQATGNRINVVPTVTLPIGWYWYSWATNETATTTFMNFMLNPFGESIMNTSGNQIRAGQKSNAIVPGILDPTITFVAAANFGAAPASVWDH